VFGRDQEEETLFEVPLGCEPRLNMASP